MQVTRSVNFTVGVSSGARVICTRVKIFSGIRVYFIFFVRLLELEVYTNKSLFSLF